MYNYSDCPKCIIDDRLADECCVHLLFSSPLLITRIYEPGVDLFVHVVGDYDYDVLFDIIKHP